MDLFWWADSGLLFSLLSQDFILFFRGRPCGTDSLPVSDQPFSTPAASTTIVSGGTALAASEAIHDGDWSLRMAGASCCGGMVQWLIEGTASWSSVAAKDRKESVLRTQLSRERILSVSNDTLRHLSCPGRQFPLPTSHNAQHVAGCRRCCLHPVPALLSLEQFLPARQC